MRIFSSAENCLRVTRRKSRTNRSDGISAGLDLDLILHHIADLDETEFL
jgi:hypothetical protein